MSAIDLMNAEWRYLTFLNYEVEPGVLERHLPDGVELDTHHGKHFLSVVGFLVLNTRIAGVEDPIHTEFEQISLRFYARRALPEGGHHDGVVFIRQIIPELMPVIAARTVFGETYVQRPTRHDITIPNGLDDGIGSFEYACASGEDEARQWLTLHAATHGRTKHVQTGSKEEFLMHRAWGFSGSPGMPTLEYRVDHPLWRIWPATRAHLEGDVKEVFGRDFVPYLSGPPALAFVAEGSDVAIHLPESVIDTSKR